MASTKSSRVNPQYKKKYRVGSWQAYERGLRARGCAVPDNGRALGIACPDIRWVIGGTRPRSSAGQDVQKASSAG